MIEIVTRAGKGSPLTNAEVDANFTNLKAAADAAQADAAQALSDVAGKVSKTGDTMTGPLTLPGTDPTDANHAARKAYVDAQRDTRLSLSGGTLTGNVTVSKHNPVLSLDSPTPTQRRVDFLTNGVRRWSIMASNAAENGNNAGSPLIITSYDDNGNTLGNALTIDRATGLATFSRQVVVTDTTASSSPTTGAFTVAGGVGIGGSLRVGNEIRVVRSGSEGGAALSLDSSAGTTRHVLFRTSGTPRWGVRASPALESGNNSGSDFAIDAYGDGGNHLFSPLIISRATGSVTFSAIPILPITNPTDAKHAANKAYVDERTTVTQDGTGAVARPVAGKLNDWVTPYDFGAVGDGTADDTIPLQRAFATGKSVYDPRGGHFRITAPIVFSANGQRFVGAGSHRTIIRPVGAFDAFVLTGRVGGGISHVQFAGAGHTGGWCINVTGGGHLFFSDITAYSVPGFARCWAISFSLFLRVMVVGIKANGRGIYYAGTEAEPADNLDLVSVQIGGGSGSATAIGIEWEGRAHGFRLASVGLVNLYRGLWAHNAVGAANGPRFLQASNMGQDFPTAEGIRLDDAKHVWIKNLYSHGSETENQIFIGPAVNGVHIAGGKITGAFKSGLRIEGSDVSVDALVAGNSVQGAYRHPGVSIAGTAAGVTIAGKVGASNDGGANRHSYGVLIESGATDIRLLADLSDNLMGPVSDMTLAVGNMALLGGSDQPLTVLSGVAIGTAKGYGARFTPVIEGGVITGATQVRGGRGYPANTTVVVRGDGTGATATATVNNGAITGLTITNGGSGYTWAEFDIIGTRTGGDPEVRPISWGSNNVTMRVRASGTQAVRIGNDALGDALTADNTRVDAAVPLRLPEYTVAGLPSAATHARSLIYVRDGTGNKRLAISDGTAWRWPDGAVVS